MITRTYKESPNQSTALVNKIGFVLHLTLGGYKGAVSWLTNTKSQASAHYVVGEKQGESCQLVPLNKKAWHAGKISNPSQNFKNIALKTSSGAYINPNHYLIGIEICAGYDRNGDGIVSPSEFTLTEWQIQEVSDIIKEIASLPYIECSLDTEKILTHTDIASYKPGNGMQPYLYKAREQIISNILPKPHVLLHEATVFQLLDELKRRVDDIKK